MIIVIGRCNDKVFDDRDLVFFLGKGCEDGLTDGVEQALKKMKKGELARITVKSKYAYGPLCRILAIRHGTTKCRP